MKVFRLTATLDGRFDDWCEDPAEAEVIVVGGAAIALDRFPRLRFIFKCGVGTDNIPDLSGTGIELVLPSPGTASSIHEEVAAFTLGRILHCHYHACGDIATWRKPSRPALAGRRALVLGLGNIGRRVAAALAPLVAVVDGFDPACGDRLEDLPSRLAAADIITLHAPLSATTRHLVACGGLRPDSILVNTARAELVAEDDLLRHLSTHPQASAAFDVFWQEPYRGPLLDLANFHPTPHVASMSEAFYQGLASDLRALLGRAG